MPEVLPTCLRLNAWPQGRIVSWVAWVEQDGQRYRADRLYAGRVELQDDPIATAYAIVEDALKKLETTLGGPTTEPLF